MQEAYLMIGEITKPQGVRGELKVRPITCDPNRFADLEYVYFKKGSEYEKHTVHCTRMADDAVFLRFDGVDDRDAAEKLRGQLLYIDREHAVELDDDEDFICDLIGCEGIDTNGRSIGKITDVMQPGGNDVYVFNGSLGEVLVPALKRVVVSVDTKAGRMILDAAVLSEVAVFDED